MKAAFWIVLALVFVLMLSPTPTSHAQAFTCSFVQHSVANQNIIDFSADPYSPRVLFLDANNNAPFLMRDDSPEAISSELDSPLKRVQLLPPTDYLLLQAENGGAAIMDINDERYFAQTITFDSALGPLFSPEREQVLFTLELEDRTSIALTFLNFSLATRTVAIAPAPESLLDIAFAYNGSVIALTEKQGSYGLLHAQEDGFSFRRATLANAASDSPPTLFVSEGGAYALVRYRHTDGSARLAVWPLMDTESELQEAVVTLGALFYPIEIINNESLIAVTSEAGALALSFIDLSTGNRRTLADNLSATCLSNALCSVFNYDQGRVIYRGDTEDGASGFFSVGLVGDRPTLLHRPTLALVFKSANGQTVFAEPLRVENDQVIFAYGLIDRDGTVRQVVSGMRWPTDARFSADYVEFSLDGRWLIYVGNPGLNSADFRLFRVPTDGSDFERRLIDRSIDPFATDQAFAASADANRIAVLTPNGDGSLAFGRIFCTQEFGG